MKFGIIGCGQMGSIIASAICKNVSGENVSISDASEEKAKLFAEENLCTLSDSKTIAQKAKYIILAVKPQALPSLAQEIKDIIKLRTDCVVVTMAAGKEISYISNLFCADKVIRIMPNTPAKVGKGIILYCSSSAVSEEELSEFTTSVEKCGYVDSISENLIDAASAITGCGPAFAYMFSESLSDGGVLCGLPRDKALMFAAKMLEGAACMVSETKIHPDTLKDAVCSPGGTTIEGVKYLEENAFRGTVIGAVKASYEKNKLM